MLHKSLTEYGNLKGYKEIDGVVCGIENNVYITIAVINRLAVLTFNMSGGANTARQSIWKELKKFDRQVTVQQKPLSIIVKLNMNKKVQNLDNLSEIINLTISSCAANGAEPNTTCVKCGAESGRAVYYKGQATTVCERCARDIEENINNHFDSPLSYLTGLAGAVVGGIAGAVPFFAGSYFGWWVYFFGTFISMAAFKGYAILKGPQKRGYAMFVVILSSFLAVFAAESVLVGVILLQNGYEFTLNNILYAFELFQENVIGEMIIAAVFSLVGLGYVNRQAKGYAVPCAPVVLNFGESVNSLRRGGSVEAGL